MILPMQQASHMGRGMSPVAGVIIAVSSGAKLQPFDVVKEPLFLLWLVLFSTAPLLLYFIIK